MLIGGEKYYRYILLLSFLNVILLGFVIPYFSGEHYLIGPDAYYNMRTCKQTLSTGKYPLGIDDKLLNYPVFHKGARPPLFNMIAISISVVVGLENVMMFLPVFYGAVSVVLLFYVVKELFDKKVAIVSSLLLSVTPIFNSYTVSYIGRFDHDTFVIMMLLFIILFLVRAISSDGFLSYIYATLNGVFLYAIFTSWVASQIYFFILIIFLVVKLLYNAKNNIFYDSTFFKLFISFLVASILSIPVYSLYTNTGYLLLSLLLAFAISLYHYITSKFEIKSKYNLFAIILFVMSALIFLYVIYIFNINLYMLYDISSVIYSGAYHSKIYSTIAEGVILPLREIVLGVGILVFWLSFVGFYNYISSGKSTANKLVVLTLFFSGMWLSTQAGRFIPLFTISMIPLFVVATLKLKSSFTSTFYRKVIPVSVILLMLLQLSSLSAYQSYSGYSYDFESRWSSVGEWFSNQDTDTTPENRPAILGWWDYGFILATIGGHPVVADNYQSGIYPASQCLTATSEKEMLSVLIVRIIEGTKEYVDYDSHNPVGTIPDSIKHILLMYTYYNTTLVNILENPYIYSKSYNKPIDNTSLRITVFNAMYIDAISILTKLTLNRLSKLYNDLSDVTGFNIGYLVVSKRDVTELFPVVIYLSDKGYWQLTYNDTYFYGYNASKKSGYYKTMGYKLFFKKCHLRCFKLVYDSNDVVVYKYINRKQ